MIGLEIKFLLSYLTFVTFVIFLTSLGAPSLIANAPTTNIWYPANLWDYPGWFFSQIVYFLQLMMVSPEITWFGILILTPLLIVLIYIIVKIIIEFVPKILPIGP